jgi:peptidoglycan/LPS O-acetylase OafA/YrhL
MKKGIHAGGLSPIGNDPPPPLSPARRAPPPPEQGPARPRLVTRTEIPALTAVRGLAAWWIVVYHFRDELLPANANAALAHLFAHGYLAVDLFFVLSGFILAYNYLAGFERLTGAAALRFLGLRLARIYPLHLFMLLALTLNPAAIVLFSSAGTPGERYDPAYFLLSLALLQNWGFTRELAWNVPAWSISTEWFAYLLFPALACFAIHFIRRRGPSLVLAAALLIVLAGGGWLAGGLGAAIPSFGLARCALEFAAGVALFRCWSLGTAAAGEGNLAAAAAAGLLGLYAVLPIPDYAIAPLAFGLLIYALAGAESVLARLFSFRLLVVLGSISYSTYMAHYFVKDWVMFLLVRDGVPGFLPGLVYLAATLAASFLLYRSVELPGRRALRALAAREVTVRGAIVRVELR